jgi:predicted nucleic acid-binding protein
VIAYLDTSALVPLLVEEPSSVLCRRLWDEADEVLTVRIAYVEAAAALAAAARLGRLEDRALRASRRVLADLWSQFGIVEVDQALVERAADIAGKQALRGYDAVHAAAAEQLADPQLVAGSGDRRLLEAWRDLDLATYDTNPA